MANPITLRRRIKTAQNVSKTTRAMQMIAASKLKKAQNAALSSKPYVEKLTVLSREVSKKIPEENMHPYLKPVSLSNKTLLLVFSPDKGLAGGLTTNLLREYLRLIKKDSYLYINVGKKMEKNIIKFKNEMIASFPFGTVLPTFDSVFPIIKIINDYYLSGKVDSVKILSTHFTSIFTQVPKVTTLLPISIEKVSNEEKENKEMELPMIFEPNANNLLPTLLKHYLEMVLYQSLLESYLSEQAARMVSMQNATQNAKDVISELKLQYNKARQEKITNEILDISSAAFLTE